MKLVVAVVRHEKLNDVLMELFKADVQGLTISEVRGHGGEIGVTSPPGGKGALFRVWLPS